MASVGEAVAENALYCQKFAFFCASMGRDLGTQVSAVQCVSYIVVATIRVELSWNKAFYEEKKKNKKE